MPHKVEAERSVSWDAELRPKDGIVSLRTNWTWHRDDSSAAGKVLECTIDASPAAFEAARPDLHSRCNRFDTITVGNECDAIPPAYHHHPALSFLWETATQIPGPCRVKFLLPADDGYVVRSDLMEYSLKLCPMFKSVRGFVQPAQQVMSARPPAGEEATAEGLLALLHSSVGVAVVVETADLQAAHAEFQARLSWPWRISTPIKHTRVAIIEESRREVFCEEFYAAAKACAVSIVILDEPGHWAEDDTGTGAKYREHFVPFARGNSPDELTARVVETIRALPYQIDGLLAIYDMLMPAVARAAEILGLPTLGSTAYQRSTDKFETRQLSPASTIMKVGNLADLDSQLQALESPLQYPLIVKPTRSHGAKGVQRVEKEADLRDALRISFDQQSYEHKLAGVNFETSPVVVETFCDGPEVDVNLLLWNGEVLHAEVVDNFQAPGEVVTKSFGSFGSLNPSALPVDEVEMLKRDVADIVRRLGLHSGVIHAEARVHNSSYEIREGGVGLRERRQPKTGPCSTFLLEVNPRFAGWFEAVLSSYVHGIDYFAAYLMQMIGDEARFRALSHGFGNAPTSHYTWLPPRIETEGSGIMPEDLGLEKLGIADSYAAHRYYWQPGSIVPARKKRPWPGVGFLMFRSNVGAEDAWKTWSEAKQHHTIQLL